MRLTRDNIVAIALSAATFAGVIYNTYTSNDRDLVQRVAAIEATQRANADRLTSIENKMDRLFGLVLRRDRDQ